MADDDVTDAPDALSIQERLYPFLTCFGCGHANPKGLRLRSFPDADTGADADGELGAVIASFEPWPEHDNGGGFLNGGIIATVLDCHTAAAMMLHGERTGLVPPGSGLAYVTAGLDLRYLRPTPLAGPLTLRAWVTDADEDRMLVTAELHADGKVRATGAALWKRWRAR
ncbi:MAG: PaaI family thioesterase [Candidatus Nanopelagicales bacterium]